MPLAVDNLTKGSTMERIREAIAEDMRYLTEKEGKSQKDAAGQLYSMAREKTGRSLDFGRA